MQPATLFNVIKQEEQDLYSILGCVDTSSPEQIKTEYKRLALLHHPDKTSSNVDEKSFEKIKAAYEIVGDPVNRAMYDRWRNSGLMVPFSDYAQLGSHAQTIHWQSLPTQMTLTSDDATDTNGKELKSVRVPPTVQQLPRISINKSQFWNLKKHNISDPQ